MGEYRTSGHAIWDIKYHLIWITKYRYPILRGEVAERARDVIRQICQAREVTIVRGSVSPDHIHLLVSVPPLLSPAKLVQYVKPSVAAGFSSSAQEILGSAHVGTGLLLRDGGRSG
jgi:putative transposase